MFRCPKLPWSKLVPARFAARQDACKTSRNLSTDIDAKPFYVTTPIFYPNAAPHIGHLHSLVTADIFARHARLVRPGAPVHFITGTDEHGLKIQQAARARDMEPQLFCDKLSVHFRNLCEKANISHTKFVRTSSPEHFEAVERLWRTLDAKDLIYKDVYEGWYSVSDECFYTSAQVMQTDKLHVSVETGSAVEWTREENYKFRLSAFREHLLAHFTATGPGAPVVFPPYQHQHVLQILREQPLDDLSVSRPRSRLAWGVPVPGDPEHTVYVWFDALMAYLSGIGYPWATVGGETDMASVGVAHGWPSSLQIIGKDILRFHAIYFPAMLHALGLPAPRALLTHAHWTQRKQKMSKSVGNVADPLAAIDSVGIDAVRYYLARVGGRFRDDVDWSQGQLEVHADEIANLLGNFFLRVTSKAIAKRIAGVPAVPLLEAEKALPALVPLADALRAIADKTNACMQDLEVASALQEIVDVLALANQTVTTIAPWSKETPPESAAAFVPLALETLRVSGVLLQPFLPNTAGTLLSALGVPVEQRTWAHAAFAAATVGDVRPVKLFAPRVKAEA